MSIFKQMKELGEDKLFKFLRKKYGSIDIGDGQKMHDYYPITAEDIRKYGQQRMVINEAIIENVVRQHFNSYPEDAIVDFSL